jgi:hypothetical protein
MESLSKKEANITFSGAPGVYFSLDFYTSPSQNLTGIKKF